MRSSSWSDLLDPHGVHRPHPELRQPGGRARPRPTRSDHRPGQPAAGDPRPDPGRSRRGRRQGAADRGPARADLSSSSRSWSPPGTRARGSSPRCSARSSQIQTDLSHIPAPAGHATLDSNGDAIPPSNAPLAVRGVIEAANQIDDLPYIWGGGHGSFTASGYDCSGSVSFALHGGGFLSSPLDSTGLEVWGEPGGGNWITVFANSGHAWAVHRRAALGHRRPRRRQRPSLEHRDARRHLQLRREASRPGTRA